MNNKMTEEMNELQQIFNNYTIQQQQQQYQQYQQQQQQQQQDDNLNKSKNRRFQKCNQCEEYYEQTAQSQIEQQSHSCIEALRERIKVQQDQMSNMVTKEQVADILRGYVSQDAFLNFVRATEKKFSELFDHMNHHEEILKSQTIEQLHCSQGHELNKLTGIRLRLVSCDLCSKKALDMGNYTMRCEKCNFDICCACEKKIKEVKCRKNHSLSIIKAKDYQTVACDNCGEHICKKYDFSFRCQTCDYDNCPSCFNIKYQSLQQ